MLCFFILKKFIKKLALYRVTLYNILCKVKNDKSLKGGENDDKNSKSKTLSKQDYEKSY